ncbi:MAG: hypothetical protein PHR19_08265 [Bacteroidales bacterium]|nr:hypothetical protein [Bacteroidales bacterium]
MENLDIIGALNDFADQKGWTFINGIDAYANYEVDQIDLRMGDKLLVVDLNLSPSYADGGMIKGINYSGILMLGMKVDDIAETSSLDETQSEKYNARLKNLTKELITSAGQFSCKHQLSITSATTRLQLNKFDVNADFVAMDIIFSSL